MSIRNIFCTDTRRAILIRFVLAIGVGLLAAGILTGFTDVNAFRSFAFPIFGVPLMLMVFALFGSSGKER